MSKSSLQLTSDYGYLNILINNNSDRMVKAEYNETRLQPIVSNTNDWQIGITRLKIPTSSIPLMIFEDGAYEIGFALETGATLNNFLTETVTYDAPANNFTEYPYNRYVFYYDQFLFDVNNALAVLWNTALADPNYAPFTTLFGYLPEDRPYFRLATPNQGYIELVLPTKPAVNPSSPFAKIKILMSNRLFYFFSGFTSAFNLNGWNTPPLGVQPLTYVLQVEPTADTVQTLSQYNGVPTRQVNVIQQDYPTLFLWQDLTRIFITTTACVEKEVLLVSGDEGKPNSIEVLTDFEIPQSQQGLREYIFYQPQGNLRYINFKTGGFLDRFDVKVFFQTKDLRTYQLIIPPTFELNIKIEFKRRKAKDLLLYSSEKLVQGTKLVNEKPNQPAGF